MLVKEVLPKSTYDGSNFPLGRLRSLNFSNNGSLKPFASVLYSRSISLKPVPGLAPWLSLEPINPNLKRLGFCLSVKSLKAKTYCAEPCGL